MLTFTSTDTPFVCTTGLDATAKCHLHVSFDPARFADAKLVCSLHDIKVIALTRFPGELPFDAMTSCDFQGTVGDALLELSRIADILRNAGIPVTREKLEIAPSAVFSPEILGVTYYEAHITVTVFGGPDQDACYAAIKSMVEKVNGKVSLNTSKVSDNVSYPMVTVRSSTMGFSEFLRTLPDVIGMFDSRFTVANAIMELAIHDTNPMLDNSW